MNKFEYLFFLGRYVSICEYDTSLILFSSTFHKANFDIHMLPYVLFRA